MSTRSDDMLFDLARLRVKKRYAMITDALLADDEEVATHTQQELLSLVNLFSRA